MQQSSALENREDVGVVPYELRYFCRVLIRLEYIITTSVHAWHFISFEMHAGTIRHEFVVPELEME